MKTLEEFLWKNAENGSSLNLGDDTCGDKPIMRYVCIVVCCQNDSPMGGCWGALDGKNCVGCN